MPHNCLWWNRRLLQGLPSWCLIFKSLQFIEDREPGDFSCGCPIYKWAADTWFYLTGYQNSGPGEYMRHRRRPGLNRGPIQYRIYKVSYRKISQSHEDTRSGVKVPVSLWNLAGVSAAHRCRDASQISEQLAISCLRDFARYTIRCLMLLTSYLLSSRVRCLHTVAKKTTHKHANEASTPES